MTEAAGKNEIGIWQEAMSTLSDKQFFNTIRLYLGEIKTPYNKQRLIEQLAAFVRKDDHIKSIITLLDSFDVQVLTAISIIPQVTEEILLNFFAGQYSVTELYAEIINLTERLLVYKTSEEFSDKIYLHINPLLKNEIQPYLNPKLLFPDYTVSLFSTDDVFILSPNLLSAFISYLKIRGISCKADGTIKKNDMNRLEVIFPGKQTFIQLLVNAFVNLSLVKEGVKDYEIDNSRLEAFVKLTEIQQYSLLCAASVSRFSKDGLKKEAQLLIDCLCSIPKTGYTRQTLLRLAFLLGTYTEDGSALAKKSRFSRILEAARSTEGTDPVQNASLLDRMIDSAIEFGLLQKLGKTEDDQDLYTSGELNSIAPDQSAEPKVLNIDSTFTVTLMPGLSLSSLLPLTSFMMIKKCGIVTEFEITRQSVSNAYDQSWTPEQIFQTISKYTYYEIPQNLKINISEWYNSYSSAMLYQGYILKVTEGNITLAENNPNIKKYIKEKLADGIYLLNIPAGSEISRFIGESGLEFLGHIKTSASNSEFVSFPLLRQGHQIGIIQNADTKEIKNTSVLDADKLLKALKQKLASKELDEHQKESLNYRISNRLILSESQLNTAALRTEILEADGMDFAGKVHLIEAAIKAEDLLELQLPDSTETGSFFTIVGNPLGISRQPGEAIMRFQVEPTKDIENFMVSRITHVRRLRY